MAQFQVGDEVMIEDASISPLAKKHCLSAEHQSHEHHHGIVTSAYTVSTLIEADIQVYDINLECGLTMTGVRESSVLPATEH